MDDTLTNFKSITGCHSDDEARKFLLMYNNDLNRAVDRYFNQTNRHEAKTAASCSAARNDVEVIESMEMDEPGPSRRVRPSRRVNDNIQRHQHRPIPSAPPVILDDDDGVRRPMAPVTGQLVNESFQQSWRAGVSRPTNGIFQAATDFRTLARQQEQRVYQHRINGGISNGADRKPRSLQMLFQPPAELLHIGPWETARHQASVNNRWLLVNLQNNTEFACACLNRDIWSKEPVQELIKKNFVFWQVADDSADCKRVAAYYNVTSFPTVLIIDPRTGESVTTLTRLRDPVSFLEELMEFLERYPDFETFDRRNIQSLAQSGPSEADVIVIEEAAVNGLKKQAFKRKLDEKEDDGGSCSKRFRVQNGTDMDMDGIDELCNNGTKLTTVDREDWRNYLGPEEKSSQKIQIVFRFPNNEREKIEIPDATPLRALFVFLDGRGFNSRDHVLVLSYPKREFTYERHSSQTLRQLGFNRQELIHVDRK